MTTLSHKCKPLVDKGILTEEPIRKYPLSLSNLNAVLKVYAVETFQPYTYKSEKGVATTYYLTDEGLDWLYSFFAKHSLEYCRSLFSHLFIYADEDTLKNLAEYPVFSNFRGTNGVRHPLGVVRKAVIVHRVKRCNREYHYENITEARKALRTMLTLYPIEDLSLYSISVIKGREYRNKLNVVIERPMPNMSGLLRKNKEVS